MTPRKGSNKIKGGRIETSNNPIGTPHENIILSYSNAIGTGCLQENYLATSYRQKKVHSPLILPTYLRVFYC